MPTSSSPRPKPRNAAERRAARWYRLARLSRRSHERLDRGNELDVVARRGAHARLLRGEVEGGGRVRRPARDGRPRRRSRVRRAAELARRTERGLAVASTSSMRAGRVHSRRVLASVERLAEHPAHVDGGLSRVELSRAAGAARRRTGARRRSASARLARSHWRRSPELPGAGRKRWPANQRGATQDALYAELDLELSWSERRAARAGADEARPPAPSRISASSSRSSSRSSSAATSPPAGASSTRSPARGRRSCRRSRAGSTRPASTSPRSTAC